MSGLKQKPTWLHDRMLKADGFDDAVVGIGYRCGQDHLLVYDVEKCINILMTRDNMTLTEADEFFEFNVAGAWAGPGTPIWLYPDKLKNINLEDY